MELKLYDITESSEYKSIIDLGVDDRIYSEAAHNTYKLLNKELDSNIKLVSFPSEVEFMALIQDIKGNKLLLSMQSYYRMLVSGKLVKAKILEVSPHLKGEDFMQDSLKIFQYEGATDEERANRKLLWLCKVADKLQSVSEYKGVTSDYKRQLVTEYMNDFSYGLYATYKIDLGMVCKILTTRQTYKNLDKAIEVIVTGETVRRVGDECPLYSQIPKYKFVSEYIDKNMSVSEIIRIFEKHKKHMIHSSKLEEMIKGREVMVDFKGNNSPIMLVAFLDE